MEASCSPKSKATFKDRDLPAHLPRDDLLLILSNEHCGSLKVPQGTRITYSWESAEVGVGKPQRNMWWPGEAVYTQCLLYRCPVSAYLLCCPSRGQRTSQSEDQKIRSDILSYTAKDCYLVEDWQGSVSKSSTFAQLPCHGNCDKGCKVITTQ